MQTFSSSAIALMFGNSRPSLQTARHWKASRFGSAGFQPGFLQGLRHRNSGRDARTSDGWSWLLPDCIYYGSFFLGCLVVAQWGIICKGGVKIIKLQSGESSAHYERGDRSLRSAVAMIHSNGGSGSIEVKGALGHNGSVVQNQITPRQ